MSWSALSSLVAMPFGQLSPRKSESRACYLTNVAADKRSSGCAWLCHALLLTRLQLNLGVKRTTLVGNAFPPILHLMTSTDPMSQTSASAGAETAFIHAVAHNENPIRALRAYAEQYHFFSLHQIRAFAGIVAHIPATDRAALSIVASVLHDELGRGIAADVHSVVFERFAASIGVDVRRLPLPETRIID